MGKGRSLAACERVNSIFLFQINTNIVKSECIGYAFYFRNKYPLFVFVFVSFKYNKCLSSWRQHHVVSLVYIFPHLLCNSISSRHLFYSLSLFIPIEPTIKERSVSKEEKYLLCSGMVGFGLWQNLGRAEKEHPSPLPLFPLRWLERYWCSSLGKVKGTFCLRSD